MMHASSWANPAALGLPLRSTDGLPEDSVERIPCSTPSRVVPPSWMVESATSLAYFPNGHVETISGRSVGFIALRREVSTAVPVNAKVVRKNRLRSFIR